MSAGFTEAALDALVRRQAVTLIIQPTSKVVTLTTKADELDDANGVPARVWEGMSADGVPVHLFVTRAVVPRDAGVDALAAFEAALGAELPAPRNPDVEAYPMRLVL